MNRDFFFHSFKEVLRQGFDKSTQKRLFVFVTNVLTNHGKVPLRHLVNEETLFIS